MKQFKYIYIVVLFLSLVGCKEKALDFYNESESGSSIYFSLPYSTASATTPTDSLHVRFGFLPQDLISTDVPIQVSITGPIYDVDRVFKISTNSNATLKENEHYTFTDGSLVVPAGKNHGFVRLNIKKTEEMKKSRFVTSFRLLPNENFNTDIYYRYTNNMQRRVPILDFRLIVDNIFEEPYFWATRRSTAEGYLGKFSVAKLNLIIKLFNEDMEHFTDPQYTEANYFSIARLTFWGSYMKYWLGKEASEDRFYYDENKQLITVGPNAS
ncbi:protein of unknown function [Sphingobacterium nematocida]|uniref:DUF4843 domain-containing protein n=1 Tax=Sphingobacterium nematocida TaxID=1513896 RepID=A0A1T5DG64_9SPHI|nr:DUF4843 domain-containing protein [Sphingobacterium nematocida]SKB70738.1 protein of unknown function [Sphingobacterium nematocida]